LVLDNVAEMKKQGNAPILIQKAANYSEAKKRQVEELKTQLAASQVGPAKLAKICEDSSDRGNIRTILNIYSETPSCCGQGKRDIYPNCEGHKRTRK
jgi:hypothetical protein